MKNVPPNTYIYKQARLWQYFATSHFHTSIRKILEILKFHPKYLSLTYLHYLFEYDFWIFATFCHNVSAFPTKSLCGTSVSSWLFLSIFKCKIPVHGTDRLHCFRHHAIYALPLWSLYSSVLVCLGYCNKMPQTGWFKQQKFPFSQFWGLQDCSISPSAVSWSLSSWLTDGYLFCCVLEWSFLYAHVSLVSPLPIRTLSYRISALSLQVHSTLITSSEALFSSTVTLEVRTSTCEV